MRSPRPILAIALLAALSTAALPAASHAANAKAPAPDATSPIEPPAAPSPEDAEWESITAKARQAELDTIAESLVASERRRVLNALDGRGGMGRLPHYRLEIDLDPDASSLRGRLSLVVTPPRPTDTLHLRLPANANQANVTLGEIALGKTPLSFRERDGGLIDIQLPFVARPGRAIELDMRFTMRVPKEGDAARSEPIGQLLVQAFSLLGMQSGASPFDALRDLQSPAPGQPRAPALAGALSINTGDTIVLSGFHPELVRESNGMPDLDPEPAHGEPRWGPLANYIVTVVAPPEFEVAGTGHQIGRFPERDGRMRTTRIAAAVRGFSLALGRGWKRHEAQAGAVQIRVFAPERGGEQALKLLDVSRRAITHFSSLLGPYPWRDFEIAAVPLGHGLEALAIPNAALASPLIADPEVNNLLNGLLPNITRATDSALEFTMAHQIAHQWFRGIVGSDARLAPAVDEGPAMSAALSYVEHRRGAKARIAREKEQITGAWRQYRMMSGPDLPLSTPLGAYTSPGQITGLLQGKAAAFHLAAQKHLGREAYRAALKRYVERHFFGEATLDDFTFEATRHQSPDAAARFLKMSERFLRQTHGDDDIGPPYSLEEALGQANLPPEFSDMLRQFFNAPALPVRPNPGNAPTATPPTATPAQAAPDNE